MTTPSWDRLQRIYHDAMASPPGLRAGLLDQACGGDTVLRRQVESLIQASEGDDAFLRDPLAAASLESHYEAGTRIGPYRIQRQLGAGGMGLAYLAERDDQQFQKQVALKVMRFAFGEPQLRARFQAERQILAALEHPNIARLLDGGETRAGEPYIVMEYVDGEKLTTYGERLPLRERVELFRKVCAAVQYAHANLVIHRDIKPANILVTGDGEPKLLDFGVAKILQPELSLVETQTGQAFFTPQYASPEQILGRPASTACDVYSLGVTLHKLLTGRVPYPEENLAELAVAMEKRDPAPPGVDSDLDSVILKAIAREPAARYASVDELSRDLDRYLRGYPVEARRANWLERGRKFAGRNRLAAAMAALLAVSAVGFGIGLYRYARRADRERDTAEQVSNFLTDVIQAAAPNQVRKREATASETLDELASRVEKDLAGQQAALGKLMAVIGESYTGLGKMDLARQWLEKSVAVLRREYGSDSVEISRPLSSLGIALQYTGKSAEAEAPFLECLRLRQRAYGERHYLTLAARNELSSVYGSLDRVDDAERVIRPALDALRANAVDDKTLHGLLLTNLAAMRQRAGRSTEAAKAAREAVELGLRVHGADSREVAGFQRNLGAILCQSGRIAEGIPVLVQAAATSRKLHPDGHHELNVVLGHLLGCYIRSGDVNQAVPLDADRLAGVRKVNGEGSTAMAQALADHAYVLLMEKRIPEAEMAAREASEILSRGPDLTYRSAGLRARGKVALAKREFEAAIGHFREAVTLAEKGSRRYPVKAAPALLDLGRALREAGREAEARPFLERAYSLRLKAFGPGDPMTVAAQKALDGER